MEEKQEPRTKLAAAVALGRRGGKVKSEAKAAAARLNGLLGGSNGRRLDERKRGKNKKVVVKKPKVKLKIIAPKPAPMVLTAFPVNRPRVTQKLVKDFSPPRQ